MTTELLERETDAKVKIKADVETKAETKTAEDDEAPIKCMIDGVEVHSIAQYLIEKYPDTWTVAKYKQTYPDAPLLSKKAERILENIRNKNKNKNKQSGHDAEEKTNKIDFFSGEFQKDEFVASPLTKSSRHFNEVFELGKAAAAYTSEGNPITITVFEGHKGLALDYLPTSKDGYVYNIDLLKKIIIGFELNMPIYLWGMHGTGKTTILQEAAARTGRPFVRVQHTMNMQESDVLGQWTVRDGNTFYQPGPLICAMINGWVYCADEYDFAMPAVTAVYQPVLEGQNLIVKDAPAHLRRIVPHPEFRFVATGNTNGGGDETGLYSGTQIMNAANFSRFDITEEVPYMEARNETQVLVSQAMMARDDATRLVRIANDVRGAFSKGEISTTISTRELISAAKLGIAFGGRWKEGIRLAFCNRLSRIDKKTIQGLVDRVFGENG